MKALLSLIFPSLKAFIAVLGFMFTVVSASYIGIVTIAKTEAKGIEEKILAVRESDLRHLDDRFNRVDDKLDKIQALIKETK
jgi:hypothetical protein